MDVLRRVSAFLTTFVLFTACAEKERQEAIFPLDAPGCEGETVENRYIVEWKTGQITIEPGQSRDQFMNDFVIPNLEELSHVEKDRIVRLVEFSPSDSDTQPDWGQTVINAQAAWNKNILGDGVTVAVIDSAVDIKHDQLAHQLYSNPHESGNTGLDGIDNDGNGYIDDSYGWNFVDSKPDTTPRPPPPDQPEEIDFHGTHVSGIVLADPSRGSMKGMAPKAKLLPLQFISSSGGGYISDAILAIRYAVDQGAKVINASWGGSGCSKTLRSTVEGLADQGVLFVTAAGNAGRDIYFYPIYPAAFQGLSQITVGASTPRGLMPAFSNFGALVHVVAPGAAVFSTIPGGYAYLNGTSMAAPFVSGAAALLWSYKPGATVAQIREALLNSVMKKNVFYVSTQGQIDLQSALQSLENLVR